VSEGASQAGLRLEGLAGSTGVALGPAVLLEPRDTAVPRRRLRAEECDGELERFARAVAAVQASFQRARERLAVGRPEATILDAYALMAGDELLGRGVERHVRDELRNAEWAVADAAAELACRLGSLDDEYLSARSHDVEFVGARLVRALVQDLSPCEDEDGRGALVLTAPSIVVARELSPADTAAMSGMPVLGFVTEIGTGTSHVALMARALGLPAVIGVEGATRHVTAGDTLFLDGGHGMVIVRPSPEDVEGVHSRGRGAVGRAPEAPRELGPATMADGTSVALLANVERAMEVTSAVACGAEGVGLYRTEYLFVGRRALPTEDEQYEAFSSVVRSMAGRPVTLRTFDLGGDKQASTFATMREANPMLGVRAVRLQLARPDVLVTQLAAMLRAAAHGPIRVMVPLVCNVDEVERTRELLLEARASVVARGLACAATLPIGAMIEVPAAALIAERIVEVADFLSIGTNDLVQHTLAVDRGNRAVAHLASPLHPAVLRLMHRVVEAGASTGRPVSLCGEMASDPVGALVAVGLGVRELSMEASAIPKVRALFAVVTTAELTAVARLALAARGAVDVERLVRAALGEKLELLVGPDVGA